MAPRKKPVRSKRLFANDHWEQCFRDFLQSMENISGSWDTRYQYERRLRNCFGTTDGSPQKRSPDKWTRAEIEAYLNRKTCSKQIHDTAPRAGTQNARLNAVSSFYHYASTYTILFRGKPMPLLRGHLPTEGIARAKTGRTARAMTQTELRAVFAVIPRDTLKGQRDYALFLTYFWSVRRRKEIAFLYWRDLELDYRFDDGHRGVLYHFRGKGKSRQDDSAELPAPAWASIKAYLATRGKLTLDARGEIIACQMRADDPIFPSATNPMKPIHRNTATNLFRDYLKRAGLAGHGYCVHSLRHTAARERRKHGQDIVELKELLRHESLQTTYTYLSSMEQKSDAGAALLFSEYEHL